MQVRRALCTVAIGLAVVSPVVSRAEAPKSTRPAPVPSLVTRVFFLQHLEPRDAIGLLRSEVSVRRVVAIKSIDVVVVRDGGDTVASAERVLRDHDAISRALSSPEPGVRESTSVGEVETREFKLERLAPEDAAAVLRTLYSIGDVEIADTGHSVSVRAAGPILEAAEALLRELDTAEQSPEDRSGARDPGAAALPNQTASEPKKLDLVWSIEGHWTGVALDKATDSIYALGAHGACAEIDASGKIKRTFSLSGADGDILRLARFKDHPKPALLTYHVWAPQVKVNDGDGNALWSYPQGDRSGIDDVEPADLDADGSDEIIVGFNATQGVHVVDRNGKLQWSSEAPKGAWSVDAGDATGTRRTSVIASNGEVHVLSEHGGREVDLDPGCFAAGPVRVVGGQDDVRGVRIVAACAPSGRKQTMKGLAVDGAIRWTLELPEDAQPAAVSALVAPDRPWIAMGTAGGAVYVADVGTGAIIAAARDLGHAPQVAWLPDGGAQSPRLLVAAGRELSQFQVVP